MLPWGGEKSTAKVIAVTKIRGRAADARSGLDCKCRKEHLSVWKVFAAQPFSAPLREKSRHMETYWVMDSVHGLSAELH